MFVRATCEDWDKWARYTARLSAWYHDLEIPEALARAHSWFVDAQAGEELAGHRGRCDIDTWLLDAYGLSLAELLAGGLGACRSIGGRGAGDFVEGGGQQCE